MGTTDLNDRSVSFLLSGVGQGRIGAIEFIEGSIIVGDTHLKEMSRSLHPNCRLEPKENDAGHRLPL